MAEKRTGARPVYRTTDKISEKTNFIYIKEELLMKYSDFVKAVAESAGVSQKEAKAVLKVATEQVTAALTGDGSLSIPQLGTFKRVARNERTYPANKLTKKAVTVPAHSVAVFRPSTAIKTAVSDVK